MATRRFRELLGEWKGGEGPLYQRLADALREAMERGELAMGTRLPAQRQLAEMLGVSRTTAVLAYDRLVQEGWLESREGSGTTVRRGPSRVLAVRGGAAAVMGSRNEVFRGLVVHTGADIEFHGAHFEGMPEVFERLWNESRADLSELLQGHGYVPLGLPSLREAIAAHLERSGLPTRPDQVLVTSGAQQAISLLANLMIEPGDRVVLEDPTYLGAIDAFTAFGARLEGVASGAFGVQVEALRETVARVAPRAVYLVPTGHNPTGSILPESERREVARIAEGSSSMWIEDLALADLTLEGEPPAPLAALAQGALWLTVGSLSKLFWGGLRVGWIRGPEAVITRLARLKVVTDLSGSIVSQAVAVRVLEHAGELRETRRRQARERLDHTSRLLARHLPSWKFRRPAGGLSLWLQIPFGDVAELATLARRRAVAIVPGTSNSPTGRFHDHLRLPFVSNPGQMAEGIERLAAAWEEYSAERRDDRRAMGVVV
ncbi:MAG TPA: PLP-dependent aminotransferase family protein [Candidatus Eisenbacteria bacterium]|nr:PLP-dependent aminotransferase family protein [Candidatus Eisenbacteria bacterium]